MCACVCMEHVDEWMRYYNMVPILKLDEYVVSSSEMLLSAFASVNSAENEYWCC